MQKNILIMDGHPNKDSLNSALADSYKKGAQKAEALVRTINIRELQFNPNLEFGYKKDMELETDLKDAIDKIKQADHIVFLFPLWWGSYPAAMKGFIDRTFLPGITFDHNDKGQREKLLNGKTARIIITMEAPVWYYKYVLLSPATKQLKNVTLEFCGVQKVRSAYFGSIASSTQAKREKWLKQVEDFGFNDVK